jgi:hypothetical protein
MNKTRPMTNPKKKTKSTDPRKNSEAGVALLISVFTLLLVGVIAMSLILAAGMESALSGNYRSSTRAYYAAAGGLEEARGRLLPKNSDYFNTASPSFVPAPGAAPLALRQVRYVLNPQGAEDVLAAYPDSQYDAEFGSGSLAASTVKTIASVAPAAGIPGALYKWVRINAVTEASLNLDVNGDHVKDTTTPLFYDGASLNLTSTGNQALEVTSLAVLPDGTQKLLQYVVAPVQFNLTLPAAVVVSGTYNGASAFGNQSAGFGISGADFCNPAINQLAVAGTNSTSVNNLSNKLTPASNYPGTGANAGPPPVAAVGSAAGSMQSFPDPLHPGQSIDLTTTSGLNQLVAEIESIADHTVPDCSDLSVLGSPTSPNVVVVTGGCSLSGNPSPPGQGILLVKGDVQYVDHPYDGLILAIGTGGFQQSASRLTHFYGSLLLAQTVDPVTGMPLAAPGTPTLDWLSSVGNPNFQYDSCILRNAQPMLTYKRLSFREIPQ